MKAGSEKHTPFLMVHTLGPLEIQWSGQPVPGLKLRKAQALLVYLVLNPGQHPRSHLAGLLWGGQTEQSARRNLRHVLWLLRRHLDPAILEADRVSVELNAHIPHQVDVLDFELAIEQAGRCQRAGKPATAARHLEAAIALYQGDFLARLDLADCPEFEEWVLRRRTWLRERALDALAYLVEHGTLRGEYDRALRYGQQLLALDPWREEAHCQVMTLLALTGQRSAALAQYEECRRLLETELGLEPLAETIALYKRILERTEEQGGVASSTGAKEMAPLHLRSSASLLPFTGREEEHAQMVTWWERARQAAGRLALVEGEAGVGKTRLVEEVTRYAEARGAVVLRGRCYEFGTGLPYQPVAAALRGQITHHPICDMQLGDVWLIELARLVPEVRETRPDLPEPAYLTGDTARQRLFEAVTRFLLISNLPFLIFFDDLHWADQSTFDLLHYLVRQLTDAPVWFVGTYRPEEVSLSHPLTRLHQGLSRDHLMNRLILEPLSPAAVTKIACSLVGEEAGVALGAFLHRESEGNPFILAETVSDLQEQDALYGGEDGHWQWAGLPQMGPGQVMEMLPISVRDVILQRVGRLSEPAQRLLTLAAVIGQQFDASLLQAAAGQDADAVDGCLDEWLRRRLVRPETRSRSKEIHYDLSHDKIRAVVYDATGVTRRQRLHRRVGEALEQLSPERIEEQVGLLAYHWEQGGEPQKATEYLVRAGDQACLVYAHQEALAYYDRALALLAGEDERRWAILLERGKVSRFLGQYDEARAACRQVFEFGSVADRLLAARAANELSTICWACRDFEAAQVWIEQAERLAGKSDERGEPAHLREQAQAKRKLGDVELELGNLERAQESFEEALALYQVLSRPESRRGALEEADQRSVAMCLHGLGSIFRTRGQYNQARHRFEEALAIYRALGDRDNEASALRAIGATYWRQGDNDAALRAFTEGLDISRAIGNRWDEAASFNNLGLVHFVQGARGEARRCWEESVALYRSLGLDSQTSYGLHNLGILHMGEGDYAAAQQCLEESWGIARSSGAKAEEPLHLGWLGRLHFLRGEYADARRRLETTLALDREVGGTEEEVWHLAWLGAVAYEMGDLDEARDRLQAAIQLAGERSTSQGLDEAHRWLAAVHLAQGDGQDALAAAQQALAVAEAGDDPEAIGQCCAALGLVHGSGLTGDGQDPAPHFERARALLEERDPFMYGAALRCYGAYLLRSGDREQGRAYLHEAQGILGRIGAQGELVKVARLLAGGLP